MKTLKSKGKKDCGFTSYALPNVEWMLRMIIWADPDQKKDIIKKAVEDKADYRKNTLENR